MIVSAPAMSRGTTPSRADRPQQPCPKAREEDRPIAQRLEDALGAAAVLIGNQR